MHLVYTALSCYRDHYRSHENFKCRPSLCFAYFENGCYFPMWHITLKSFTETPILYGVFRFHRKILRLFFYS